MTGRKIFALVLLCIINFFHFVPIVFAAYSQAQKITASDGDASDSFGSSAGIDGNYAVLSASSDDKPSGATSGSAYVFYNNGAGSGFAQQAKLEASDKASGDNFGWDAAIIDPLIIVGARNADDTGGTDQGEAYIFKRSGTSWTQKAALKASNAVASDFFGNSVGIDTYTAIVGAPTASPSGNSLAGTAYTFSSSDSGETWSQQTILAPASVVAGDNFGISVDIDGDYAIVGAAQNTAGGNGKATIYFWNGSSWTLQQTITASDAATGDSFGTSVSINGSYATVGASYKTVDGLTNAGAVYVFVRSGTTWTQQQKVVPTTAISGAKFGGDIDMQGNNLVVGREGQFDESGNGRLYLFTRSGTTWTQDSLLTASDGATGDILGAGVGIAEDGVIVASAPGDDISAATNQGSAYFFTDGGGWSQSGGGVPEFSTYVYLLTLFAAFALIKKQSSSLRF